MRDGKRMLRRGEDVLLGCERVAFLPNRLYFIIGERRRLVLVGVEVYECCTEMSSYRR